VFVIGQPYVLRWFLLGLIPVTGAYRLLRTFNVQDIFVEKIGTPSPPPAIGLLRRLMLRVPALLTIIVAMRTASLRRSPTVSVPSGV